MTFSEKSWKWAVGVVLALIVAVLLGVGYLVLARGSDRSAAEAANDAADRQAARQDCARVINNETTLLRDRAASTDRYADRGFDRIILYASRNPGVTIANPTPELSALIDVYDASVISAERAEARLDRRLKRSDAKRVEGRCPSV